MTAFFSFEMKKKFKFKYKNKVMFVIFAYNQFHNAKLARLQAFARFAR